MFAKVHACPQLTPAPIWCSASPCEITGISKRKNIWKWFVKRRKHTRTLVHTRTHSYTLVHTQDGDENFGQSENLAQPNFSALFLISGTVRVGSGQTSSQRTFKEHYKNV